MKDETELKFYYIYLFNNDKFKIFWEYIKKNLKKEYIRPSQSLTRYPILFILKKDNKLRLYIDYRQFNVIIKKNCYLLPFISELKDRLFRVQWFIVLNLPGVYSLIRIKERYKWKIIFKTKFGYFEYLILSFGFINVLIIF